MPDKAFIPGPPPPDWRHDEAQAAEEVPNALELLRLVLRGIGTGRDCAEISTILKRQMGQGKRLFFEGITEILDEHSVNLTRVESGVVSRGGWAMD